MKERRALQFSLYTPNVSVSAMWFYMQCTILLHNTVERRFDVHGALSHTRASHYLLVFYSHPCNNGHPLLPRFLFVVMTRNNAIQLSKPFQTPRTWHSELRIAPDNPVFTPPKPAIFGVFAPPGTTPPIISTSVRQVRQLRPDSDSGSVAKEHKKSVCCCLQ